MRDIGIILSLCKKEDDAMNLKAFNEIEDKYSLPDLELEGYNFWNYIRKELGWKIQQEYTQVSPVQSMGKVEFKKKIIRAAKTIENIVLRGMVRKRKCDLLVLNHERRVWVDDVYQCIYTDDIVNQYDDVVVLEAPYHGEHYTPIMTKNIKYTDMVEFYAKWFCVFNSLIHPNKFSKYKQLISNLLEQPIHELNEKYHTKVELEKIVNDIIYGFFMYKVEKKYYRYLISKFNPRIIIEVVGYSRKCMVVNEIALERDIPTIEFQHGMMGEEHFAYNYPRGYKIKQFPQFIFLFGDYWKTKSKFPIANDHIISVGYPYMDKMVSRYKIESCYRDKINILFLSTGPIGLELSDMAIELNNRLDSDKYSIVFKLHPAEYATWKERYPRLYASGIEVIDNNKQNLYQLFATSNIQISGLGSTTIFEGLYFSLTTFILGHGMMKEFKELCNQGLAYEFNSVYDLYNMILNLENRDLSSKAELNLWKKDGLRNMKNEIDEMLDKCKG